MIQGIMSPENADRAAFGIGYGMQLGVHAARPRENSSPDCFLALGLRPIRRPLFRPQAGRRAGTFREVASIITVFGTVKRCGSQGHNTLTRNVEYG